MTSLLIIKYELYYDFFFFSTDRGTPDSGVEDILSLSGGQTPVVSVRKLVDDQQEQVSEDLIRQELEEKKDESLLSEDDKAQAVRRPASSFTGLRRGQLEGVIFNA